MSVVGARRGLLLLGWFILPRIMGQVGRFCPEIQKWETNPLLLQGLTKRSFAEKQEKIFAEAFTFFDKNNDGQVFRERICSVL